MPEINHRIGVKAAPKKVYAALTTNKGLSKWWTSHTSGAGDVGSVIKFDFNGAELDFKVIELEENRLVRWHCTAGSDTWLGTEILFTIKEDEQQTLLRFCHSQWLDVSDFLAHCSTKWAIFLMSLKDYVENGKGQPYPDDVQIDYYD